MQILSEIGILLVAYLIGSIPFGLLVVKWKTGKDIRLVESGRTGGTNAMRAAGLGAGLLTAAFDILKGAGSVWLARAVGAGAWIEALAPVAAILGHNYSIFLPERKEDGRWRLRGGAGGAPALGGSIGLWAPSSLVILPLAALIYFGIGYASVTTMSVAVLSIAVFTVRAALGLSPWQYVLYGVLAEALLVWALRPNLQRLAEGTERLHGWRAKRQQKGTRPSRNSRAALSQNSAK
ncbi:MAG: glycerol-3-phosphate acyltransferase [Chloroflexi bacterium]|nr:glycerol-3-phosphate acyltransferase [Chloroflexota bacterium]